MGMDKYGCFMQYMFIISETIVNSMKSRSSCDWLFADDVTHSRARAPLTQDQARVNRES